MKATSSTTLQITQTLSGSADSSNSTSASPSVNVRLDSQGNTALHYAVYENKLKRITALLQAGAPIDAANWEGQTPLHVAVMRGNLESIRLLIAQGAQINVQDLKGRTPSTLAFNAQRSDILTVLQTAAHQRGFTRIAPRLDGSQVRCLNYHADQLRLRQQIAHFMFEKDSLQTSRSSLEAWLPKLRLEHRKRIEELLLQTLPAPRLLDAKELITTLYDKLTNDSALFEPMNALMRQIKSLQANFKGPQERGRPERQRDKTAYDAVEAALQCMVNTYEHFRRQYCEGDAIERKELQQLPTFVSGFGIGHRMIMAEFAPNFRMDLSGLTGSATLIKREKTGVHRVIRLGDAYFKINPDAPGIEFAVDSLNKILTRQGSAPTELLVVTSPNEEPLPVLASKAVEGVNFMDALKAQPDCAKAVSDYHFSLQMILSLLTNPADAKPDNFIATGIQNAAGEWQSMELVGIDNDHAFAYPISEYYGEHRLEIKSVFYCMPQMNKPIDKAFAEKLLSHRPWQVTIAWLKSLVVKNHLYEQYQSFLPAETLLDLGIPLRLVPGTVETLYQTLVDLQKLLREQSTITHHQLLNHFYPLVAVYYAHLREKWLNNPLDAIVDLYCEADSYEKLIAQSELKLDDASLSKLRKYAKQTFDYVDDRTQLVEEVCETFITHFDFRTLEREEQGQLLDQVAADFPFLQSLTLNHCDALNDIQLEAIARRLRQLRVVCLIHCADVTITGLSALLSHHPELSLTLDGFEALSVEDWLTIAHAAHQLTVVLPNGERHMVHYQNTLLLQRALENQYDVMTEFLLRYGVLLNYTDALHQVAGRGNIRIVQALLHYGAPINYRNPQGDTAIDMAALNGRVESVAILLRQGAIDCRKDRKGVIFEYGLKVLNQYPTDTLLHQQLLYFGRSHQLLYEKSLAQLLLPSTTVLDISGHFPLTDEMVQVLVDKKPALDIINLSHCQSLSQTKLQRLEASGVKEVYLTFNQAVACGLIDYDSLEQLNALKINQKMAVHISQFEPEKPFTPTQIERLSDALKQNNRIGLLSLWKAKLQSQDIIVLAPGIQYSHVQVISMEKSQLDKPAMAVLAEALKAHPWVKELRLDSCGITQESAKDLYTLLAHNTTLETFSLYNNTIGHHGLASLGSALMNHPSLTHLNINQTGIDSQSAILFMEALQTCPKLQSLDIGYNQLAEEAGRALLRLVKKHQHFQDVRYGGNQFSDRLTNQLREAIAENQQAYQHKSHHYYVQMHEVCLQNAPRYLLAAQQVKPIRPPRSRRAVSLLLTSHRKAEPSSQIEEVAASQTNASLILS